MIQDREKKSQGSVDCICLFYSKVSQNIRDTWAYMDRVSVAKDSPLLEHVEAGSFLRITATQDVLAAHLKHVMMNHCCETFDPAWWVEVTSDKDIVHAWLFTAKFQGIEITDADVALTEIDKESARSVKDLALRADLMVIRVGRKIAANKETRTTLREAIDYRVDLNKPVWLVDTPRDNLDHADILAYSKELMEDLSSYHFLHVDLSEERARSKALKTILPIDELEEAFEPNEAAMHSRPIRRKPSDEGARQLKTSKELMQEEQEQERARSKRKKNKNRSYR